MRVSSVNRRSRVAASTSRSLKARRTQWLSTKCLTGNGLPLALDQEQQEHPKTSKPVSNG